jgi:hypothetical protein
MEMRKDLPIRFTQRHWFVLVLLIAFLGFVHSMMVSRKNAQVYEVETLPSNFKGEIDYFDPLAKNSHARLVHGDTLNDDGKAVFLGPNLDLAAGNYRVSFVVRALQVWPGVGPIRVEVGDSASDKVLASQLIDVQKLNRDVYEEILVNFSLDAYTPGIEFRAFYPGQGAFWFDYIEVRKETNSPWNMTYLSWPLLAALLGVVLFVNRRRGENGISVNIALRHPAVEGRLAVIGYFALAGVGLYSFVGKYFFDIERIIYAYVIDDAFYYFETAANLAQSGKMSFDTLTYSNGFHPLWGLILVPVYWLGLSKETSFLIGIMLADTLSLASLLLLFWVLKRRFNILLAFALTLLFFSYIIYLIQYGLETPVLITSFVALLAFYDSRFQRRLSDISFRECGLLGLLLGLVVLARLDHGIFVATFLVLFFIFNRRSLFVPKERNRLITVAVGAGVLTVPYLLFNYFSTGYFVPVSGVIKSIWSDKMLMEGMHQSTYLLAKTDSALMVLAELQGYFWPLIGSVLIVWVLLVRRQVASIKTLLPFILGPILIFAYYLIFYQYPFNSSVWYYPTIWLAGLLTIGLVIDHLLDQFQISNDPLPQGILIGGLSVLLCFQVIAQFNNQRGFFEWVRTQTFEDTYKFLSWRAAEYIQAHDWPSGADDKVVFAAADSGVLGVVLDEPVVNLDGLINNEILPYEIQDKHWHEYAVARSEIDYVVNVFRKDWLPPPLFEQHFKLCYFSQDFNRENLGFRIYGRKTALLGDEGGNFTDGCVAQRLSSWWAGEMGGGYDQVLSDEQDGNSRTIRCVMPSEADENIALVFGPNISLPAGAYSADYFMSVNDNPNGATVARLEITNPIDQVVASRSLTGSDFETAGKFQRFSVPFRLADNRDNVEFKVFSTGELTLCIQGASLLDCNEGCNPR